MSDVYTKKRKRDDGEDVSQAETVPAVKKTALPEAAPVDLMGWGPKYIGQEALNKYVKERDEEQLTWVEYTFRKTLKMLGQFLDLHWHSIFLWEFQEVLLELGFLQETHFG